jgi:hypothetical protein
MDKRCQEDSDKGDAPEMIPIECPDCHTSDWKILETKKQTMCVIREDAEPMIQTDFPIVQCECNQCHYLFWAEEAQAECLLEEF